MKKSTLYYSIIALACFLISSCSKNWLDIKSNKQLVVPATASDLQGLLDNFLTMNIAFSSMPEALMEEGTDDYFYTASDWVNIISNANVISSKNAYLFNADIFENQTPSEWNIPYTRVLYANTALEGLSKLDTSVNDIQQLNKIKGSALFIRANAFAALAETFSLPYDSSKAAATLGIPIRLVSDINQVSTRATQEATWSQIQADLKEAATLLPGTEGIKTRPTSTACYALLARTYLNLHRYDSALQYAVSTLQLQNDLLDYNSLSAANGYPIPQYNPEVIYSTASVANIMYASKVDTVLYNTYGAQDLRKQLFFKENPGLPYYSFRGSYDGSNQLFSGLTTDETYLIQAECLARSGRTAEAMDVLNFLLEKRSDKGQPYEPLIADTDEDALQIILSERRKELLFRGIRWMDLRRLNIEGANITVTRNLEGKTYSLSPNSNKYAYPIPVDVIRFSALSQNER